MAKASNKKEPSTVLLNKQQLNAQAKELSEKLNVKVLYSNAKQEFFTDENAAFNSDKKENIVTYDFSKITSADVSENSISARKITQEDLDANPELVKQGAKVGDDFIEPEVKTK
jgi:hypothetical protein